MKTKNELNTRLQEEVADWLVMHIAQSLAYMEKTPRQHQLFSRPHSGRSFASDTGYLKQALGILSNKPIYIGEPKEDTVSGLFKDLCKAIFKKITNRTIYARK